MLMYMLRLPQDDAFDKRDNLQTALRARGYRTGVAGKWHLSSGGNERCSQYQRCVQDVKETGWTFAGGHRRRRKNKLL
jgi:arylsulfatase A-like enzyme